MQPVILDTDVASRSHTGKLDGPLATRLIGRQPVITFVTLAELVKWTEIRDWGSRRRQALADWLSAIPAFPGMKRSPERGGGSPPPRHERDCQGRSTTCGSPRAA